MSGEPFERLPDISTAYDQSNINSKNPVSPCSSASNVLNRQPSSDKRTVATSTVKVKNAARTQAGSSGQGSVNERTPKQMVSPTNRVSDSRSFPLQGSHTTRESRKQVIYMSLSPVYFVAVSGSSGLRAMGQISQGLVGSTFQVFIGVKDSFESCRFRHRQEYQTVTLDHVAVGVAAGAVDKADAADRMARPGVTTVLPDAGGQPQRAGRSLQMSPSISIASIEPGHILRMQSSRFPSSSTSR